MPAVKQAYSATNYYPSICSQLLSQVGIIKPYYPDITALIADDSLGAPSTAQPDFLSLPHVSHNSLFLALSKLRDMLPLAIVKVTVWEEIEQVADCLYTKPGKLCCQSRTDAPDSGDGGVN